MLSKIMIILKCKNMQILPPNINLEISLSNCCNAITNTIPACFGDPALTFCSECKTECQSEWKPVWEKTGPGSYKRINYELKN